MKWALLSLAVTLAACVTAPPDPTALTRQHERNVALAHTLGYEVVSRGGETRFCATHAPTASHIVPACFSESDWERLHPVVAGSPGSSSGVVQSGRSASAGTPGY